MRNCRSPRRRVRDVTRTRSGGTDETLSRKSLARVQGTACKKAQVSSARTLWAWRHQNTFRNYGYNALGAGSHLLRSVGHTLAKEGVEKMGKVEYCGSIRTLRSLLDQVGDVCKVWLRSVQKREFVKGTNKQTFSFIHKIHVLQCCKRRKNLCIDINMCFLYFIF